MINPLRRAATVAILAAAALAAATACGASGGSTPEQATAGHDTSTSPKPAGKVETVATGWGVDRSDYADDPDYMWATAVIRNGTDQITAVQVQFDVYGPDGKVIAHQEGNYPLARAGATIADGTQMQVPHGVKVDKVVATVSADDTMSKTDDHPDSKFEPRGVHYQPGQYGENKVLGQVVSHYDNTVSNVLVSVVCYDGKDHIDGGGQTTVTSIGHGQTVGFSVDDPITSETPARCVAYPTLSMASGT